MFSDGQIRIKFSWATGARVTRAYGVDGGFLIQSVLHIAVFTMQNDILIMAMC